MNHSSRIARTVFLLAASLLAGYAQTAQISGRITDSSDAVIPGVQVLVTNTETGAKRTSVTNDQGYYAVPLLQPGMYDLLVQHPGFKPVSRQGVRLAVNQAVRINFTLEVGEVTESVNVVGEVPLVNVENASVGLVVERRRISELPLNGRNTLALVMLAPGVRSPVGATNSGFTDRGVQLSAISINGGPTGLNNFQLDGATNTQGYNADLNVNPAVDAIEEFKVHTASVPAEYGFTAGGVVNIVTKSGTNEFRGTLYEFLRNDKLDARNAFALARAPFRFNQFGGALGGPVLLPRLYQGRNRTFFFTNYEEWRFRRYLQPIARTPTEAERAGDFSELRDVSGRLIEIYDPASIAPNPAGSGFVRTLFPGNRIPANRLDPVSKNILPFYPLPNRPPTDPYTNSNNYIGSLAENRWLRQSTVRLDHRVSSRNNLFFRAVNIRHFTDGGVEATPYPDPLVRIRRDYYDTRNFIISDTHTFSANVLNEFRLAVARMSFTFNPESGNQGWPQKLGMPSNVPPDLFPHIRNGMPNFNIGVLGTRATLSPQLVNTLSVNRGRHSMKFGTDLRTQQASQLLLRFPSGLYNFPAALTGNPQRPAGTGFGFATFMLGAVGSATATTHLGFTMEGYSMSYFAQDDWKVTPRLTLNLGIRYDYQSWPRERHNGSSNFNPFATDPRSGLPGRLEFAGVDYQGTAMRPDRNNWGPRFGFAYDPAGNGRTVLRGGYSILYPFIFYRHYFEGSTGFAETTTSYLPPGGDSNFPAFWFRDGLPSPPVPPQGSKIGPSALLGQDVIHAEAAGRVPMSQQWNFSVQRQLGRNWLVEAIYSANHGTHLVAGAYDFNQLDPRFWSLGMALQDRVPNPNAGIVPGALGGATITRAQSLRPYPHYNQILIGEPGPSLGNSIYHAFMLSVEKKMADGFTLQSAFTAGKLINDSVRAAGLLTGAEQVAVTGYQNGKFDRRLERSVDPTDVSRRWVVSGLYDLPFGPGRRWNPSNAAARVLASGWQVNAIATLQTGLPLVIRGANNFLADRPDSIGRSARLENRSAARWFDTEAFLNPPNFTLGNAGRALPDVRSPAVINVDMSVLKNTPLGERLLLQFRAEAFNAFNHVNLGLPNTTFVPGPDGKNRSGTFGVVTSARDARIGQLGLKLVF